MTVSSFKDLSWGDNEPISTDKLNTMVSNTRYLFERAPRMYYNAYSVQKDTGVKIACGTATIPPGKGWYFYKTIQFGAFFTAGSRPIIVTSVTSASNRRMILSQYGIQGSAYVPDNRGFTVCAASSTQEKNYSVPKQLYINWIAMGY